MEYSTLYVSLVIVIFSAGESGNFKYVTKNIIEGEDLILYATVFNSHPCVLHSPNPEIYPIEYRYSCDFIIKGITPSHHGKWIIMNREKSIIIFEVNVTAYSVAISLNDAEIRPTTTIKQNTPTRKIHFAAFYYEEGDTIDVVCINRLKTNTRVHNVALTYSYAENLLIKLLPDVITSQIKVGLRTTLRAAHNNTKIICKCLTTAVQSYSEIIPSTHYEEVQLKFLSRNSLKAPTVTENSNNVTTTSLVNMIKIQFNPSTDSRTIIPLQLNLSRNNVLIDIYTHNNEFIYYEYEDGDQLSLNCSTSPDVLKYSTPYYLNFSGKVSYSAASVTLDKRLSSTDNDTILKCYVIKNVDPRTVRKQITVLLRMRSSKTALEDITRGNESWIILVTAFGVICFLICAAVVIYKMKKWNSSNKRQTKSDSRESRDSKARKSTSDSELQYAVPNFRKANHAANEAFRSNSNSKSRATLPELTYAVLDIPVVEGSKHLDPERVLYAEVAHNVAQRK